MFRNVSFDEMLELNNNLEKSEYNYIRLYFV